MRERTYNQQSITAHQSTPPRARFARESSSLASLASARWVLVVVAGARPPRSARHRFPRAPFPEYVSPGCVSVGGCVSIVGVLVHRGCVCSSCLRLRSGSAPRVPSWARCARSALNGNAWGSPAPSGLASALRPFALGPSGPPRPVLGSLRSLRFKRGRGGLSLPSAFGRMNVCA